MRAIVCGGRDADPDEVWNWLEKFGHQDAAEALRWPAFPRITTLIPEE